jgi:hypothetical protein
VAINVAAPDEGNMFLLGKIAVPGQRERYLLPMLRGESRSTVRKKMMLSGRNEMVPLGNSTVCRLSVSCSSSHFS